MNQQAEEIISKLITVEKIGMKKVEIERIESKWGVKSEPESFWYDQNQDEYVIVTEGEAKMEVIKNNAVEVIHLKSRNNINNNESSDNNIMDGYFIPAHVKHRVIYTMHPTVWIAIHFH